MDATREARAERRVVRCGVPAAPLENISSAARAERGERRRLTPSSLMDAGWRRTRLASRALAGWDGYCCSSGAARSRTNPLERFPSRTVPSSPRSPLLSSLSLVTMSSSASGGTSNLVSVSAHLHLAPPYAAPPPNDSLAAPAPPTKPAPPNPSSTSSITPFQPDELRQLVLDYLTNSCYVDTATAFARELAEASAQADSSGGDGSGKSDSVEGPTGEANGAGAVDGTVEAMEGVEATPEPFAGSVDADGGLDGALATVANGSGKNVAFLEDGTCEADDDADLPEGALLTKDDLRDLRIRRSACRTVPHPPFTLLTRPTQTSATPS